MPWMFEIKIWSVPTWLYHQSTTCWEVARRKSKSFLKHPIFECNFIYLLKGILYHVEETCETSILCEIRKMALGHSPFGWWRFARSSFKKLSYEKTVQFPALMLNFLVLNLSRWTTGFTKFRIIFSWLYKYIGFEFIIYFVFLWEVHNLNFHFLVSLDKQ